VLYVVNAPEEEWRPLLSAKGPELLAMLFNVSAVRLHTSAHEQAAARDELSRAAGAAVLYESQDIPGLVLQVVPAQAIGWRRCERCWNWTPRVGEDALFADLCERCTPVVRALRTVR
jgi:hypothetical protein